MFAKLWRRLRKLFGRCHRQRIPTLPSSYCDPDRVILHACFAVLVEAVERDGLFRHVDWSWREDVRKIASEIRELYHWWKVDYPTRQLEHLLDHDYEAEDQKMLHRLIDIRPYLWT